MTKIDLHLHSYYSSDGEFTPQQLVDMCLEAGITHTAVADHNTIRAINETLQAAEGTSLTVIPCVELEADFNGLVLHILGYGIDPNAAVIYDIEHAILEQERANSGEMIRLSREQGFEFDDEFLARLSFRGMISGEMIAEAALAYDHEEKNPLLDPYRGNGARSDNPLVNFHWDYFGPGKPAFVHVDFISLAEVIAVINANGGVPILAHPGLYLNEDLDLFHSILAEGVQGVEVYSSYHTPEQTEFYLAAAQAAKTLITCGSDFHGKAKISIKIGSVGCDGQDEEILMALLDAIDRNQ